MGDGEVAGDGTLAPGMGIGPATPGVGELRATEGDSKPNLGMVLLPPTGPPLIWLGALAALMVTELLRACCSPGPPLGIWLRTMGGTAPAGSAGVMLGLPFIGAVVGDFPF